MGGFDEGLGDVRREAMGGGNVEMLFHYNALALAQFHCPDTSVETICSFAHRQLNSKCRLDFGPSSELWHNPDPNPLQNDTIHFLKYQENTKKKAVETPIEVCLSKWSPLLTAAIWGPVVRVSKRKCSKKEQNKF